MPSNFKICILLASSLLGSSIQATNYYADPSTAGSMANPGSFASPWANLSSIFAANKTFVAGDTIFLRTGNHGYALIRGINTGFVVIMPQPGENPVIERIRVSASAAIAADYWKLYGLTIQSEATGMNATPSYFMVEIYPYATHITISHCLITSNLNTTAWTRDDWRNRCNNGLSTRGKLNAQYIIEDNRIENIAFGLSISSSNTIVRGNKVHNFTNDGSRVVGSDVLFEHNSVTDLIKVMTVLENHDDLFQSFTYPAGGTGQDTLKNNIIRNNIFINTTDTARQFRGNAQGIGCFDGVFLNWRVENNIVITDHWHGISFYGAVNCTIVNNTVIDPYLISPVNPYDNNSPNIGPTWIRIDKKSSGPPSSGNIVKNNLVASSVIIVDPTMGFASNNISMGALTNYSSYFTDVSDFALPGSFDLHLKTGCSAIDAGDSNGAPMIDYEGIARPQGLNFDIGAYEYLGASGTGEQLTPGYFSIYPNPSNGKFFVDLGAATIIAPCEIAIYNTQGACVFTAQNSYFPIPFEIDLSSFQQGVYLVLVDIGSLRYGKTFVKH